MGFGGFGVFGFFFPPANVLISDLPRHSAFGVLHFGGFSGGEKFVCELDFRGVWLLFLVETFFLGK